MPRFLLTACCALLALALPMPAAATAAAATAKPIDSFELAMVKRINAYRASKQLPPLRIDHSLTRAASWHARDMGVKRYFSHTDSLKRDPFKRLRAFGYPSSNTWRGENIAAGNADVARTYRQWLTSSGHRANWLRGQFRAIGISRVSVPGSPYRTYWVTTFGSRWVSAPR